MFKLATMTRRDLRTPGIVRIIAELVDSGVCVEVASDPNDRKLQRHIRRLAKRLHCGYSVPVHSREPLSLSRGLDRA